MSRTDSKKRLVRSRDPYSRFIFGNYRQQDSRQDLPYPRHPVCRQQVNLVDLCSSDSDSDFSGHDQPRLVSEGLGFVGKSSLVDGDSFLDDESTESLVESAPAPAPAPASEPSCGLFGLSYLNPSRPLDAQLPLPPLFPPRSLFSDS